MKRQSKLVVALTLVVLIFVLSACGAQPPWTLLDRPSASHTATAGFVPSPTSFTFSTITPTLVPMDPGSGTIAFLSDRDGNIEIYAMHADGSSQTNLTKNSNNDVSLGWSPDGTSIVFESNHGGNKEINMLNLQDGNIINLTYRISRHNVLSPDLSPDGKKISFQYYLDSQDAEIYVMNADGGGLNNLTTQPEEFEDMSPVWSPDGTKIAFVTNRNGFYDIYVMNADGSGLTNLTTNNNDANYPAWSPDGTKIAFQSLRHGQPGIYVMNADGSDETVLTTKTFYHLAPVWSPNGRKIAFVSLADGNGEVYVMDADGSNTTNLTKNSSGDHFPAWSPDGRKIAFVSNRDGNHEIYMMNAVGSGLTNLTKNVAHDFAPAWSPAPQNSAILFLCKTRWTRLKPGMYASVTEENSIPNRVRLGPSLADEVIAQIYSGTPLKVIEGPFCAHGLVFWRVEHKSIPGGTGWTAEGDGNEYWLEPYKP